MAIVAWTHRGINWVQWDWWHRHSGNNYVAWTYQGTNYVACGWWHGHIVVLIRWHGSGGIDTWVLNK